MQIQEYVDKMERRGMEIDCIWVKDANGNFITVPGSTEFKSVEVSRWTSSLADLSFVI